MIRTIVRIAVVATIGGSVAAIVRNRRKAKAAQKNQSLDVVVEFIEKHKTKLSDAQQNHLLDLVPSGVIGNLMKQKNPEALEFFLEAQAFYNPDLTLVEAEKESA